MEDLFETLRLQLPSSNAKERTDPAWAVVCLWAGALSSIGAGSFLIMQGILR